MADSTYPVHRRHVPTSKEVNEMGASAESSGLKLEKEMANSRAGGQHRLSGLLVPGIDVFHSALPAVVSWGLTISLIFGGCCSNVFALEAIIKEEPESGLLITFTQFLITFLFTLPTHFSSSNPPLFLRKPAVPLRHWMPAVLMFFTVNMMNNFAFGYQISVPVHIILRSGGSVTTMLVGYLWGKKYSRGQVLGVAMLTVGVVIAALADAQSKGKMKGSSPTSSSSFLTGLAILLIAQLLSAVMGLYVQLTYARFGPHWNENLFYSHFLSLPLFLPFSPTIWDQCRRLIGSPPLVYQIPNPLQMLSHSSSYDILSYGAFGSLLSKTRTSPTLHLHIPTHVLTLAVNSLTQYACIRGVNLLGARTSALGVTVVLNLRKLVSLFASIWLFGNSLPVGVSIGAAVVFSGAGVYAWAGQGSLKAKKG